MKIGDKIPVTIAGHAVAQAEVRELADGTVTIIVPATKVVMATRTEIDMVPPAPVESAKETIITGVDRPGETSEAQTQPETPPAQVADNAPVQEVSVPTTTVPNQLGTEPSSSNDASATAGVEERSEPPTGDSE